MQSFDVIERQGYKTALFTPKNDTCAIVEKRLPKIKIKNQIFIMNVPFVT